MRRDLVRIEESDNRMARKKTEFGGPNEAFSDAVSVRVADPGYGEIKLKGDFIL
ncbi:MAG: hypothetical protein AAGI38_22130 [Bacteroidota bacterium]